MKELEFYTILPEYGKFLNKRDDRVRIMSSNKQNRPYIGVLFTVNRKDYIAPLGSPKPKHLNMKNNIDFIKIDQGNLGVINLNNMIPVNQTLIRKIPVEQIQNQKYKDLLNKQRDWIKSHQDTIKNKANTLYQKVVTNQIKPNIKARCCDYVKLEHHLDLYLQRIAERNQQAKINQSRKRFTYHSKANENEGR